MGRWLAAVVLAVVLSLLLAPVEAHREWPPHLHDYSATIAAEWQHYYATRDANRASWEATRQVRNIESTATLAAAQASLNASIATGQANIRAAFPTFTPVPTRVPRTTAAIRATVQARFFPTPTPTPTDAGRSQDNPAPHGHALDTPDNWRITVLDTIPHYERRVLAAGFHIPPEQRPPAGWHWLAIKLRFTNLGPAYPSTRDTIYDRQREMPTFRFEFVSASRQPRPERWCGPTYFDAQDLPDDVRRMPEAGFLMWRYVPTLGWLTVGRRYLSIGHTDEGWTCRMIQEHDTESLVMFYAGTLGGEGIWHRWWKL